MSQYPISLKPFGEQAILIEWPSRVEEEILHNLLEFAEFLRKEKLGEQNWEYILAYNSLTLVHNTAIDSLENLISEIKQWYEQPKGELPLQRQLWRLPVCYDHEFGLDLPEVAERLGMSEEKVIELHSSHVYTVYGIGFLPGFMYLGGLPESLEIRRKEHPRLHVDKGSVGLAGKQTGIYPQDSPGGWNIIGSCPIPIFNVEKPKPCFVNVGDRIQFYPVNRAAYDLHKIETEVGIYNIENTAVDV